MSDSFNIKNVILFVVDSLRYDRIGYITGNKKTSPTIDYLAKNGISCNNIFSCSCPTQLAMPSVMTSTLPLDYNGYDYGIKYRPNTLAEVLQSNNFKTVGYVTGTALSSFFGYNRGFDDFLEGITIDLFWFNFRKHYINYYLSCRKTGTISDIEYYEITGDLLQNVFEYMLYYCEGKINEKKEGSFLLDREMQIENYELIQSRINDEIEGLIRNPKKYIDNKIEKLQITNLAYDYQIARYDLYDYLSIEGLFIESKVVTNLFTYNKKQFMRVMNKFNLDWIQFNKSYYGGINDELLIGNMINYINNHDKDNIFMWAHLIDLHGKRYNYNKIQLPILKIDKYGMFQKDSDKSYDLSVRKTDEHISRIFDLLSKKNILDETLIIITADHGFEAGFPNRKVGTGSASFYDEFIHIPLILYNPQISPMSINSLCSSIDIAPTILSLLGIDIPDTFKGYPVFSKEVKEREYVISEHTHRGPCDLERKPLYISIRTKEYKLIWKEYIYNRDNSNQQFELYDLIKDPFEKNNVYSDSRYSTVQEWLMDKVKERYKILKSKTEIAA